MPRVHLVDGTFELFRAHFSKRPDHRDRKGKSVKATVGVVASILGLFEDRDERATHVAVAFDNPIRSFRNDLFAGYKSDEGIPDELRAQFDRVEEGVLAIGVPVWSMKAWEADDALATAAARFAADSRVDEVRILTPDKDLGQCLREGRVVQVDRIRRRVIDAAALRERRGIAPESIPDWLALVGDTADGIPGIAGFGEKTASQLLGVYAHLEHIPARAGDWRCALRGADALAERLVAERDDALLYRRLATLVTDVPLREGLDDLAWRGIPRDAFAAFCDDVGAPRELRERLASAT